MAVLDWVVTSWAVGLVVFATNQYLLAGPIESLGAASAQTLTVAAPVLCSIVVFIGYGLIRRAHSAAVDALVDSHGYDGPLVETAAADGQETVR